MLFRPNLMIHMTDDQFSINVPDALVELGRNVLAGRAVLRDHPLNTSQDYFNVTTFYLTMVVLNLGNIRRIPYFANRKRFPSRIRDDVLEMRKRLVLPHLVVNNPGLFITLCESFDFSVHSNLCIEYHVIGIQVGTEKRLCSPQIAIFVKSQCGLVEIMYHWDEDKKKESHIDEFWMIHAVLARCIFGPKTHDIDEGTRERTEVHRFAFTAENRRNTHGCKDIVTPEDQLDNIETYEEITSASYYQAQGLPESFVQRLGMAEVRVLTVHINSFAFRRSILRVRQNLRAIFAKAIMSYVDFITGDFIFLQTGSLSPTLAVLTLEE